MSLALIIPKIRREPFDDHDWPILSTAAGTACCGLRGLSRLFPPAAFSNGEIAALDDAGRPRFRGLMFGRRAPVYVAFDVLVADGQDLRSQPLSARKAALAKLARRARDGSPLLTGCLAKAGGCSSWWSRRTLRASWPSGSTIPIARMSGGGRY